MGPLIQCYGYSVQGAYLFVVILDTLYTVRGEGPQEGLPVGLETHFPLEHSIEENHRMQEWDPHG